MPVIYKPSLTLSISFSCADPQSKRKTSDCKYNTDSVFLSPFVQNILGWSASQWFIINISHSGADQVIDRTNKLILFSATVLTAPPPPFGNRSPTCVRSVLEFLSKFQPVNHLIPTERQTDRQRHTNKSNSTPLPQQQQQQSELIPGSICDYSCV